jgi:negative modulator of initiation of replication
MSLNIDPELISYFHEEPRLKRLCEARHFFFTPCFSKAHMYPDEPWSGLGGSIIRAIDNFEAFVKLHKVEPELISKVENIALRLNHVLFTTDCCTIGMAFRRESWKAPHGSTHSKAGLDGAIEMGAEKPELAESDKRELPSDASLDRKFTQILGALHERHADRFWEMLELRSKSRLVFAMLPDVLAIRSPRTRVYRVGSSGYWVYANQSLAGKERILIQTMGRLGYDELDASNYARSLSVLSVNTLLHKLELMSPARRQDDEPLGTDDADLTI